MAYTVTETKVVTAAGGPEGRVTLCGNSTASDGSTSFTIQPGSNTTTVTGSTVLRVIDKWTFENATGQRAPVVVKSYSTTIDGDILTITCTANDTYFWWVEGPSAGASS